MPGPFAKLGEKFGLDTSNVEEEEDEEEEEEVKEVEKEAEKEVKEDAAKIDL